MNILDEWLVEDQMTFKYDRERQGDIMIVKSEVWEFNDESKILYLLITCNQTLLY